MEQLNYYFGELLIAKIKLGLEKDKWYLFLPHEEVHGAGGRGPYSSLIEAKKALGFLVPIDARKFVKEK